jgi:hypothetical protein
MEGHRWQEMHLTFALEKVCESDFSFILLGENSQIALRGIKTYL